MIELLGIAAFLIAAEAPSVPVEFTALAALIGIVWWLVRRSDQADKTRDEELRHARLALVDKEKAHAEEIAHVRKAHADELAEIRTSTARTEKELRDIHRVEIEQLRATVEIQRTEKHNVINDLAAAKGALTIIRNAADQCECGVLGPVPAIIAKILQEHP